MDLPLRPANPPKKVKKRVRFKPDSMLEEIFIIEPRQPREPIRSPHYYRPGPGWLDEQRALLERECNYLKRVSQRHHTPNPNKRQRIWEQTASVPRCNSWGGFRNFINERRGALTATFRNTTNYTNMVRRSPPDAEAPRS